MPSIYDIPDIIGRAIGLATSKDKNDPYEEIGLSREGMEYLRRAGVFDDTTGGGEGMASIPGVGQIIAGRGKDVPVPTRPGGVKDIMRGAEEFLGENPPLVTDPRGATRRPPIWETMPGLSEAEREASGRAGGLVFEGAPIGQRPAQGGPDGETLTPETAVRPAMYFDPKGRGGKGIWRNTDTGGRWTSRGPTGASYAGDEGSTIVGGGTTKGQWGGWAGGPGKPVGKGSTDQAKADEAAAKKVSGRYRPEAWGRKGVKGFEGPGVPQEKAAPPPTAERDKLTALDARRETLKAERKLLVAQGHSKKKGALAENLAEDSSLQKARTGLAAATKTAEREAVTEQRVRGFAAGLGESVDMPDLQRRFTAIPEKERGHPDVQRAVTQQRLLLAALERVKGTGDTLTRKEVEGIIIRDQVQYPTGGTEEARTMDFDAARERVDRAMDALGRSGQPVEPGPRNATEAAEQKAGFWETIAGMLSGPGPTPGPTPAGMEGLPGGAALPGLLPGTSKGVKTLAAKKGKAPAAAKAAPKRSKAWQRSMKALEGGKGTPDAEWDKMTEDEKNAFIIEGKRKGLL